MVSRLGSMKIVKSLILHLQWDAHPIRRLRRYQPYMGPARRVFPLLPTELVRTLKLKLVLQAKVSCIAANEECSVRVR